MRPSKMRCTPLDMSDSRKPISIAIETTCRAGGVALGRGDVLVDVLGFDAARRSATQVVTRLDELVRRCELTTGDIDEIYVSVGPGSFTGTRIGVTVARTLAQVVASAQCVAVPTVQAVVENVCNVPEIRHLAVVFDARCGQVFTALFDRRSGQWVQTEPSRLMTPGGLLDKTPRPLHVIGEGLGYHVLQGRDVTVMGSDYWLPRVQSVWNVGRQLAAAGRFVDYRKLLPIYTSDPAAVRKRDALDPTSNSHAAP